MKKKPTERMMLHYGKYVDPRKEKRYFAHWDNPVESAYYQGQESVYRGQPRPNPYPPGRRHDEFERGTQTADAMGSYHGFNE